MKKYIIIAGVNGAGKSTLYKTKKEFLDMPRVNTDEILREFGDWQNPADLAKAGKEAVKLLKELLQGDKTFNQETTLCGKTIISNIRKAKENGFRIEMHYVSLDSADIAKKRVAHRVSVGGHGIPEEDIEKRYVETFENLKEVLPMCDLVALYDNTEEVAFRRIAIYKNGEPIRVSGRVPEWYKRNFCRAKSQSKRRT